MNLNNYSKIMEILNETDKVLDIGGWERPFNRANYVIDIMPYQTRKTQNSYPSEMSEQFLENSWIIHDINQSLPFKDKEFDFVTCGHVLEDIKDPIKLCTEIIRVSKAGYIEFPNRSYEMRTCVDPYINSNKYVGYCHHRWLIEIKNGGLYFVPKTAVHSVLPFLRCKKAESRTIGFFWKDSFDIHEFFFSSYKDIVQESIKFRSVNDNISEKYLLKIHNIYRVLNVPLIRFLNKIKNGRIKDD